MRRTLSSLSLSSGEEYAHKQHTQFLQFDSALKDKDTVTQSLRQELANNKENSLQELEQALQDVGGGCGCLWLMQCLFKATVQDFFMGASAGNLNLRSRSKGSSTMVVPVRRQLRTKTPAAAQRVPSMGLARRRMRSKGPPPQPPRQPLVRRDSGPPGEEGDPPGACWRRSTRTQ